MSVYLRYLWIVVMLIFSRTSLAGDPPDFGRLIQKFKHAVLPMELQEDMWLRQNIVSIEMNDEDNPALKITEYVKDYVSSEDIEIDDLRIKRFTAHTQGLLKEIIDLIYAQNGEPYYCINFKNLVLRDFGEPGFFDECKKETDALLQTVESYPLSRLKYRNIYLVTLEGRLRGIYQRAFLFVESPNNRERFLMYDFDLVHEI